MPRSSVYTTLVFRSGTTHLLTQELPETVDPDYSLWFCSGYQQDLNTLQASRASRLVNGSLTNTVLRTEDVDQTSAGHRTAERVPQTHLSVDVSSGLSEPHHTVRVPSERGGVSRRLVEAARHCVHLTPHLHQVHHALQLVEHNIRQ